MPITYTMKIDSLDCVSALDGLTNVVSRAIWTMTGIDGDLTAATSACTELPAPTPEQPFISFDDLTEATVIGWVEVCADETYLESRREVIVGLIADQIAPPIITPPLPWVETEEAPE